MPPTVRPSTFVPTASRVTYWQDGGKDDVAWYDSLPPLESRELRDGDIILKKAYGTRELSKDEKVITRGQKLFARGTGKGSSLSEHAAIVGFAEKTASLNLIESVGVGIVRRPPTAENTYLVFRPENKQLAFWASEAAKFLVDDTYSPAVMINHLKLVDPVYTQDRVSGTISPNGRPGRRGATIQKQENKTTQFSKPFIDRQQFKEMQFAHQKNKNPELALSARNAFQSSAIKTDEYSDPGAFFSEGKGLLGISGRGLIDQVHKMLHEVNHNEVREVKTFCSALVVLLYEMAAAHLRVCCKIPTNAFGSSPVDPTTTHPKKFEAILYEARREIPLLGKFDTRADSTPKGRKINI